MEAQPSHEVEDSIIEPLIVKHSSGGSISNQGFLDALYRKIAWRILPFLALTTLFCYVDRNNISLAAIDMSEDLGITKQQYGAAASIFFVTYMIFQIPSNVMLRKVGGPIWLGTILIGWGIAASLTSQVKNIWHLYLMRLLLGFFEAGTFPGSWYYIAIFFSKDTIPFAVACMDAGSILGMSIGPPLAGALLSMDNVSGLRGWQWMFFIEGIPTILLGCIMMFYLPKAPSSAKFLSTKEQDILAADKCVDPKTTPSLQVVVNDVLLNWNLWANLVPWVLRSTAKYASHFWIPLWIGAMASGQSLDPGNESSASEGPKHLGSYVAFLSAIPFAFTVVATLLVGLSSTKFRETKYHVVVLTFLSGIFFCLLPTVSKSGSLTAVIIVLSLTQCTLAMDGPVICQLAKAIKNETKFLGFAWGNAVANLSGLVGPYMVGALVVQTGSYAVSLYLCGAMLFLSGSIFLLTKESRDH